MNGILKKQEYIPFAGNEKIRIAVMFQVASYWASAESFYKACANDSSVDVRIFYVREVSVEKAQVEGSDEFLIKNNIAFEDYSEEKIKEFRPHAALYQPPYDVSYRNPDALSLHLKNMGIRIVYIPYGVEFTDTEDARLNHFHTFVVRNAWRIYTFSERMKEDYFRYCPNRFAVRSLGLPRFDSLADKASVSDNGLREKAAGRKIILWKMHFPKLIYENGERKQVTPDLSEYRAFASYLDDYSGCYFVVMPHPMFFTHTLDEQLAEEARALLVSLSGKENVYIDRSADYRCSLYSADAVITDRSAVMIEAGFLDVPVLYMKNPFFEEPLTDAVKELVEAYEQGFRCEDMLNFLNGFIDGGIGAEKITKARDSLFPYKYGSCGADILEDIKSGIMHTESSVIKLVFFGASYICRHYIDALNIMNDGRFELLCLSDNDRKKWHTDFCGAEIVPPEKLKYIDFDLLVISSEQYYMPIKKQLVYDLFLDESRIIRLDEFAEQIIDGRF